MRLLTHTVTPQEAGLPVRTLLRRQLRISGSFLAKLKRRPGAITPLNGVPVIVSARTEAGDVLAADVSDLPGENPHIRPVAYPLDILWEDEDLLLLNKPAGIAIHPAALTEETVTVAGAVCHYLRTGSFHCVNRLDRGTTGVMAVAKTGYIHRLCMESLHTDSFLREYRGICLGTPQPSSGAIDLPISRDPGSLLRRTVDPMGLPARTLYETLLPGELSLLRLLPQTGRTHQLRLHLSAVGHPLAGDWLYGTEDPALIPRPALHSYRLRLLHPVTRRWLDVTAPLPEDMRRLLPPDYDPEKAARLHSRRGSAAVRRRPLFHHLPGKALCLLPDPRQAHHTPRALAVSSRQNRGGR